MGTDTPVGDTSPDTPDDSATDSAGTTQGEPATGTQGEQQPEAPATEPSTDSQEPATGGSDAPLGEAGMAALRAEREAHRQAVEARQTVEAELEELRPQAAEAIRLRAILDHGLTVEDLPLIGDGTAEEVQARAKALAERLAQSPQLPPDPSQGMGQPPPSPPKTNAEIFADLASRKK